MLNRVKVGIDQLRALIKSQPFPFARLIKTSKSTQVITQMSAQSQIAIPNIADQ
jgi:hypothetical protein